MRCPALDERRHPTATMHRERDPDASADRGERCTGGDGQYDRSPRRRDEGKDECSEHQSRRGAFGGADPGDAARGTREESAEGRSRG
jgi:hypothetical protein